jgi:hypothetical protein
MEGFQNTNVKHKSPRNMCLRQTNFGPKTESLISDMPPWSGMSRLSKLRTAVDAQD